MITSAEAILRLLLDMTRIIRAALDDPEPNDEITWFILQRFLEDWMSEFIYGYREDIGVGPPEGAPKKGPIIPRERPFGWNVAQAEAVVRAHIPIKILPEPEEKTSATEEIIN